MSPAEQPVDESTYSGRIAARLRELRKARGWLVSDLTKAINQKRDNGAKAVAVSTVHGWDNGSSKIDPDRYPTLARVFGISVRSFLPKE